MTASIPIFSPMVRVTDANGDPVALGTVEFYNAGTSTPKTVYADKELTSALGTTVSTDSGGYPVTSGNARTLVYTGTDAFKMIVKDASAATLVTHDNVPGAVIVPDAETSALSETPIVSKTTTYTVVAGDQGTILNCNCTSASFAVTLLSAVTAGDGFEVTIRHVGTANQVTVRSSGTETISHAGKASYAVALKGYGQTITLVSDGANWQTKASSPPRMLDGVPFFTVADRLTATPASPTPGARYIITGSPTGAWSTLSFTTGQVAEADGNGSWFAYTPADGWTAFVEDEDVITQYRSGTWTDLSNVTAPQTSVLKTARYELQYSNGTGGGTPTANAFTNDALDKWVEVSNTTSSVTMATGVWTFAAGTYFIILTRGFYNCNDFQSRFKSTTTSTAITSPSGYTNNGALITGTAVAAGFLTLTGSEAFSPQYLAGFAAANGLGLASSASSDVERYGAIEIIDLTSIQGPAGEQGDQGADGLDASFDYVWNTATSGDPGSGKVRGNNATIASITELGIHKLTASLADIETEIATWDDSTSSVRAKVYIVKEGSEGNRHSFAISGAGTDAGDYWTFPVTYIGTSGTISNGNAVAVNVSLKGDKGDTGAAGVTGSTTFTFSTTTTDSDPGSGVLRLNNATASSATAAYIDNNNSGGSDISAWLDTFDDTGESAFRGHVHIYDQTNPTTVFRIYKVTGSVTDGTGYRKLTLDHIAGAGSFTNGNTVIVAWLPRGATGVGDTTGPASSTDNAVPRFDGTGGKTLQGSAVTIDDSGNIAAGLGTVSAPAYSFSGDSNTGVYSPGANLWAVTTNGSKRLHIAATGEVTIGDETSPNAAFNVITSPSYGGSDWTAWFRHEGSAANNESLIRHEHFSNTQTPLPIITGIANRGTIASRSAVQTNDYLFVLDGRGYDGSATDWTEYTAGISDTAAQIAFRAAENWSGSAHGAKITFTTVAIGATTATLRWTLNDTGGWSANGVTGGDKGAGTINATNLYVNNVAALTVNNLSTATAGQLGYYSGTHTVAGSGNFTVSGSTLTVGQAGVALGGLALAGSTSGNTTLQPAAAASGTLTLPAATDTLVGRATTDTLTNKTLTSPTMTTPTLGAASATSIANAAGSASAPSYTFTGDTNTGFYSPGADTLAWAVGGVQHMSLAASTLTLPGSASASTVLSVTSQSTTASHRGDVQFFRNNNGSALSNGWWVGTFNFFGYDGASNLGAANFACIVDGAVSSGVVPLKIQFQTGTNSSPSTTLTLTSGGSVVCGNAALSTSATDGFLYIPTCAGTPSGTPTAQTGRVAIVFDTTNNKLCVYDGGWLQTVALT